MIVRERPSLWRLFFLIRGSVLISILPQVLFVTALSAAVVIAHHAYPGFIPSFSGAPIAIMAAALSIFLGFRNSACYDRWWEGRKAWGQLLISARILARQTLLLEERGLVEERKRLLSLTIAFCHALVGHLRKSAPSAPHAPMLSASDEAALAISRNGPDVLLRLMTQCIAQLKQAGKLSDIEYQMLDHSLGEFTAVQGICERIRNTPVPFAYSLLLHRTAHIFCFFLPFGFVDVLGWFTPLASTIMAYTFFGLDALGDELEEPFGTLPNDLPIATMARVIEIHLLEALGQKDLPAPLEPKNFILM